jgi:hypothetical protein
MLGWPKRCKMAHAFLWQNSYKRPNLAQLLGRLDDFLTCASAICRVDAWAMWKTSSHSVPDATAASRAAAVDACCARCACSKGDTVILAENDSNDSKINM